MNLQSILKTELAARSKRNPNYSMRSFAKFLEMDPSLLSKFLNGKRNLSMKTRRKIADKIQLPVALVEGRGHSEMDELNLQFFSDIRYELILELTRLDQFVPNADWIADKLEMRLTDVTELLSNLQKMGILEIGEDNRWTVKMPSFDRRETEVFLKRTYQKEIFDRAYKDLERSDIECSNHSSTLIAADSRVVLEVKRRIKNFQQEIQELLKNSEKKDTVFSLAIACSQLDSI